MDVLDRLRAFHKAAALFDTLCDFQVLDEPPPDWFVLASGEPVQVVGRDSTGGRFVLHQPPSGAPALLYISSEGEAGAIADSLPAAVSILIALPYWRDCLKFSAGGRLDEMRRARDYFEADLRARRPDIDLDRERLYRALGVTAPEAPLEALHAAVSASASRQVVSPRDRNPFDSLFNKFAVPRRPT
jgi:hypothetical protein